MLQWSLAKYPSLQTFTTNTSKIKTFCPYWDHNNLTVSCSKTYNAGHKNRTSYVKQMEAPHTLKSLIHTPDLADRSGPNKMFCRISNQLSTH